MNLEKAREFLIQAEVIAKEQHLLNLEKKISAEHDNILSHENQWQEAKNAEIAITDLIDLAQVNDSLMRMLKKQTINLPQISDEVPVMLMILSEGGISLFSRKFTPAIITDELNEQLIGGFLSAVNSFSSKVFASNLDRARLGEYSLVMKPLTENIMICYEFKGATYYALQRLLQLINILHKQKGLEQKLAETFTTNRALDSSELMEINTLINGVFLKKVVNA